MEAVEKVISLLVGKIADRALAGLMAWLERPLSEDETRFEQHILAVEKWSRQIQFYGISAPLNTDSTSIELSVGTPRKFRTVDQLNVRTEEWLLTSPNHCLILGDPGAGKTTTLKRIARRLFTDDSVGTLDQFQFPVHVPLRSVSSETSLALAIATAIGLKVTKTGRKHANLMLDGDEVLDLTEYQYNGEAVDVSVPRVLNSVRALVLLDGLDEVTRSRRDSLEEEIVQISMRLRDSKVLLSCRSGEYARNLEGFEIVEICPLDHEQIQAMTRKFLNEEQSQSFVTEVARLPYSDLCNRPLLLAQLMVIFVRYGALPDQPQEIYQKMIRLLLEEWDAERRIRRVSKYGCFGAERKLAFLSAIAYRMTYALKTKVFDRRKLEEVYKQIHQNFGLPADEACQVAREIEGYTGIVIQPREGIFEFSHLSLQEYLCANFIVRDPQSDRLGEYLTDYPAPIAVAVSLAAIPSVWFAALVLRPENFSHINARSLEAFLARLILENPNFEVSAVLGVAALQLCFVHLPNASADLHAALTRFLQLPNIKPSMAKGMDWLTLRGRPLDLDLPNKLYRRCGLHVPYGFVVPEEGTLPKWLLRELVVCYGAAPGRH